VFMTFIMIGYVRGGFSGINPVPLPREMIERTIKTGTGSWRNLKREVTNFIRRVKIYTNKSLDLIQDLTSWTFLSWAGEEEEREIIKPRA